MVAHRIVDPRILRLIRQWLRAGILESNEWHETDRGTPQGITPLLANIFLHYALDLWIHQWRRRHASGRISIVRYADDFVMGFEKAADARPMLVDLKDRLTKFGLALHEDKTRLIEFGRLPALRRQQRGERRPETFAFPEAFPLPDNYAGVRQLAGRKGEVWGAEIRRPISCL